MTGLLSPFASKARDNVSCVAMLEDLPADALKLVLEACLLPAAGTPRGREEVALGLQALRTLAALRCVSRHCRAAALQAKSVVAAQPRHELAAWLRGVPLHGLLFITPTAPQHSPWMPGYSLTTWLDGLRISGSTAIRRALEENLPLLASSLQTLSGVPLSADLPIPQLTSLRRLELVNSGEEEALRLRPLAVLQYLEELSAKGYYTYDLTGLPASVRRLRLQWQGGGGRVRMPPGAALELLHLEGMDLLLPHTALERCDKLLIECFALFLALPAPPCRRQRQQPQQPALTAGQLQPLDVARRLLALLRSCSCGRVEVVANLIRVVQPLTGDYDFRSMTPIAGRCVEDGGSGGRDPNLQLTSLLQHLADSGELEGFWVSSREEEGMGGAGYRRTVIEKLAHP